MASGDYWLFVYEMLGKYLHSVFEIILVGGVCIALFQWRLAKQNRRQENFIAFMNRVNDHNWRIAEKDATKYAVSIFCELTPAPNKVDDGDLYWATRLIHLGHLNLALQAWKSEVDWNEMPKKLVTHLKNKGKNADIRPGPYQNACSDLWNEQHKDGGAPNDFMAWLDGFDR